MRYRQRLTGLYSAALFSWIPAAALLYFSVELIVSGRFWGAVIFGSLFLVIVAGMVVIFKLTRKEGFDKSPIAPYSVSLEMRSFSQILVELERQVRMTELIPGVFCGRETGREIFHWFIFHLHEYDASAHKRLLLEAADASFAQGIIPKKVSRDTLSRSKRCNILVIESPCSELPAALNKNAVEGLNVAEGWLDVIIDLSTNTLYIPALFGGVYGQSVQYRAIVTRLLKYLGIDD